MDLALASGIAPAVWAEEGARAVATAVELLEQANTDRPSPGGDGRVMSG